MKTRVYIPDGSSKYKLAGSDVVHNGIFDPDRELYYYEVDSSNQIKKLTPYEQSNLRDEVAMRVMANAMGGGMTSSYNARRAFAAADEFMEARAENMIEVEMDCGCHEINTEKPKPKKPMRIIPNVDKSQLQETRTYDYPANIKANTRRSKGIKIIAIILLLAGAFGFVYLCQWLWSCVFG